MRPSMVGVNAAMVVVAVAIVVVLAGVFLTGSEPPPAAPEGLLGPAWSTTAPQPSPTLSVAPRASRSAPRSSPSALPPKPRVTARPATSPTRKAPPVRVGSWWVEQMRDCIARRESGRNLNAQDPTGTYFGRYQFDRYSWHKASGLPGVASDYGAAEQDRAFYVWFDNGKGRHRWTTYGYCQNLYGGPE